MRPGFNPWVRKNLWWRERQPILPDKSQGQRSMAGYRPWSHKRVGHDSVTKPPPPQVTCPGWHCWSMLGSDWQILGPRVLSYKTLPICSMSTYFSRLVYKAPKPCLPPPIFLYSLHPHIHISISWEQELLMTWVLNRVTNHHQSSLSQWLQTLQTLCWYRPLEYGWQEDKGSSYKMTSIQCLWLSGFMSVTYTREG